MMQLQRFLTSSVGKKQIMGVTGLLLCGFLVTHLLGNFLIICGPESFNKYAHALITNPLIIPAEIILAIIFLSHIGLGLKLTIENNLARPQKYYMKVATGRGSTLASSTMPYTGFIILAFLIKHLIDFKYGSVYMVTYDGVEMRDLHKLVMETFANPFAAGWYIFAQLALGVHVSHGFQSAFQSIGFNNPKYTPTIKKISLFFAVVIFAGFSSIVVWAYLKGAGV